MTTLLRDAATPFPYLRNPSPRRTAVEELVRAIQSLEIHLVEAQLMIVSPHSTGTANRMRALARKLALQFAGSAVGELFEELADFDTSHFYANPNADEVAFDDVSGVGRLQLLRSELEYWLACPECEVRPRPVSGDAAKSPMPTAAIAIAPPVAVPLAPEPTFVFAPDGDGYYLSAYGVAGHFKRLKGLDVLARLVAEQGRSVSVMALNELTLGASVTRDRRSVLTEKDGGYLDDAQGEAASEPIMDAEYVQSVNSTMADLKTELAEAEKNTDLAAIPRIQREIETLKACMLECIKPGGGVRRMPSPVDKLRKAIHGQLNTAYSKLRESEPSFAALADHFGSAVRWSDASYTYSPAAGTQWQTAIPDKIA